jgi:copper chaperone
MLLKVEKMTCNHCVRAVTAAVHEVAPGATVDVDLGSGSVRVDGAADVERTAQAIRDEGYQVEVVER